MATFSIKAFFLNWFGPTLMGIGVIEDPHSIKGTIAFIVGLGMMLVRFYKWYLRSNQAGRLKEIEIQEREIDLQERRLKLSK